MGRAHYSQLITDYSLNIFMDDNKQTHFILKNVKKSWPLKHRMFDLCQMGVKND